MKTKTSPRFWIALALFSLIGQVAWVVENMYFNVFIYKMFHASAGDISLMVGASAVTATLTTVLMGALSDRIGKRKLLICGGYLLWGVSIFSFVLLRTEVLGRLFPMVTSAAALGVSLTVALDCVMTFFGSTANDAAFNAWLTDSTHSGNRGAAEGINAMMPLVAILAVFGGFMFFDLNQSQSWVLIFSIIGGLVLLVGILGLLLIQEPPLQPSKEGSILYGFRPSTVKKNPVLYLGLVAFIVFNISIQIFMPYLILYYEVSLGMANYVLIMAPAIVIASVVTALWGKLYDKKGFGFCGLIAVGGLLAGYLLLFFFRGTALVFLGSLLMMSGYLAGMAVFGALIRNHTPEGKAGKLQGVRIFAQVFVPGIVGPWIGKLVLTHAEVITNNDGTTSFIPNANIFLAALLALLPILPFFWLIRNARKPRTVALETPFEKDLDPDATWDTYPRPQLQRDSYLSLNGPWTLRYTDTDGEQREEPITVPFPPESRLSGIRHPIDSAKEFTYQRTFRLPQGFNEGRVLLHFGAVDQFAEVQINGVPLGRHEGGYLPFSYEITTQLLDEENTLTVKVQDPLDQDLPYGKQRKKRGGMWYTPISGIWQSVWLESVPREYVRTLKITPTLNAVTIEAEGGASEKVLTLKGKEYRFKDSVTIPIEEPRLWSPEDPYLYRFQITCGEDHVASYFALRTVEAKEDRLLLNGKPYFFHGLLDQGYFSDGIYLPATAEGYENDILQMKACGFNTLRKHIKIEPALFYYYCDKYGMLVFQDMVNSGRYDFMRDTAIPTVLTKKWRNRKASSRREAYFSAHATGTVQHLYNHPSVVYYTIFNEGWGQFDADANYRALKHEDPTRIWDTTSGWFKKKESDVESEHIYFKPVKYRPAERPTVLSEFGGYSCRVKGHIFNPEHNTGYKFFTEDPDAFEKQLLALYEQEILPAAAQGLCGSILTQLSDVEDETNGLLTYDRAVLKVDPHTMRELAEKLRQAIQK